MKTRYLIILLNIFLTLLYYLSFRLFFHYNYPEKVTVVKAIELYFGTVSFLTYYNLINLIWIGVVTIGLIRKNKELIIGGFVAVILSVSLFLLLLNN